MDDFEKQWRRENLKTLACFVIAIAILLASIFVRVYLSTNGYIDLIDYINKNM